MGVLKTCCGFYCAMTSLVGIYFFLVLAVMEIRKNPYVTQIIQNQESKDVEKIDTGNKAIAFFILAGIELIFAVACYICGASSLKSAAEEEEMEAKKQTEMYSRLEQ